MLCPGRDKLRLGVRECPGSKRPMLCPEQDKIRLGYRKCLDAQEAQRQSTNYDSGLKKVDERLLQKHRP